jgi:YndJ-like protein
METMMPQWLSPVELFHERWECVLVMFAAIVLVPSGLRLLGVPSVNYVRWAAFALCGAYLLDAPGFYTTDLLMVPYLFFTFWLAIREALEGWMAGKRALLDTVRVFGLFYLATGAVWAFCFVAGLSPLGFDPVIVSLTAAHFHLAGFVLTTAVYCLLKTENTFVRRGLAYAALAGMPLVATGITVSKLGGPVWIEGLSGAFFAVFALVVAWQHLQQKGSAAAKNYWRLAALCLMGGAVLASLYALRFQWPLAYINIPNMKLWHGTVNTVGFGWMVLLGWQRFGVEQD